MILVSAPSRRLALPCLFLMSVLAGPAVRATDFNKNGRVDGYEDPQAPVERRIEDLLAQMTLEEKTCQLATLYGYGRVLRDPLPTPEWKTRIWKDGIGNIDEMHNGIGPRAVSPYNQTPAATAEALNTLQRWFIEQTRLGIPVDFTNEGIRGLNYVGSTNFPCNLGLGATWDRDLAGRVGAVIAAEARAVGYTNVYAPIMDTARDPRWGRVVESYSEDPYLVTEIAIRMARSLQDAGLTATAKTFAVYSEPKGGRDGAARTDPHVTPREMEMIHLWPWERLVRETGIRGVMSSYNDYDGVPVSGSHEFLVDRLRRQWGFTGYVVSDSGAVEFLQTKHRVVGTYPEAAAMFVREGGNVRTNFTFPDAYILGLRAEVAAGRLDPRVVDERVRDVLRVKFLAGIFDHPYVEHPERAAAVMHRAEHQQVALEAARKSLVLLKNEGGALPLSPTLKRILVCGPTAQNTETWFDRYGANHGRVVSPLEGIRARLAGMPVEVTYAEGCPVIDGDWPESEIIPEPPTGGVAAQIAAAAAQAKAADVVIVFLGDANATIGEARSRTSLELPGHQNDLVRALVETGKPVVAVLLTGRPASVNYLQRHAAAILSAWFPGEAGGTAIAEALFGDLNPGGKLPITFPRTVGQLPYNFPFKPGSHATQDGKDDPNGLGAAAIEGALYPFGHGLSYTTFAYRDLRVSPAAVAPDGEVSVTCTVTNTGRRAGDEVVQLYCRDVVSSVTTYELNLVNFQRVSLQPGESRTLELQVPARALALINRQGRRVVEPGAFELHVGSSSTDLRLHGGFEIRSPGSGSRP
ncbi:glycoside hydrolase family 3 C-terminal domain-containing protein [Opitutus sp. ER46]|uniref:glycoside hydrolase family 3 C-terminal domain-containing protein n=1 Tax=Opitutus sp. ER46 TaxID=2161864 RepID=UPI000D2FC7B0|nr:glycoside hydrolase family 3 C-terminal domain-containing protein [Opitutus sp. ER46]PTX98408.1 glycosyl hydrolase [Opitutus sp. ER46]